MDAKNGREMIDAAMSEKAFQKQVIQLAKMSGWKVHHQLVPYVMRRGKPVALTEEGTDPGVPDLLLCHPVRCVTLHVELKTEKGTLSKEQIAWRDALIAAKGIYYLWRPRDWEMIVRVIGGRG